MIQRHLRALLLLAAALATFVAFSGFTTTGAIAQEKPAPAKPLDYPLGAGDMLRVQVFQNPDLTIETRVSENGSITYPLIGAVPLGGLSIAAAEKKIAETKASLTTVTAAMTAAQQEMVAAQASMKKLTAEAANEAAASVERADRQG